MRRDASTPAFEHLGLDDRFGESGDYERVIDKYGISARRIAAAAEDLAGRRAGHRNRR
jgi:transketolase C-terminal domain/subunit